jgi:ankyrin repeat protein
MLLGYLRRATFDEYTALMVATYSDNLPLARLLLEKGAEVQYTGCWFANEIWSPIHLARSAEMAQLLLDHSADPNWLDGLSRQPLHWYAIQNDIAVIESVPRPQSAGIVLEYFCLEEGLR